MNWLDSKELAESLVGRPAFAPHCWDNLIRFMKNVVSESVLEGVVNSLKGWAFDLSSLAGENLSKIPTWEPVVLELARTWKGAFFFSVPSDHEGAGGVGGSLSFGGANIPLSRVIVAGQSKLDGLLSFRLLSDSVDEEAIRNVPSVWAFGGVDDGRLEDQWRVARTLKVRNLLGDRFPEELPVSWSFDSVDEYASVCEYLPPVCPTTKGIAWHSLSIQAKVSTRTEPERLIGSLVSKSRVDAVSGWVGELCLLENPQELASRFLSDASVDTINWGLLSPRRSESLGASFGEKALRAKKRFNEGGLRGRMRSILGILSDVDSTTEDDASVRQELAVASLCSVLSRLDSESVTSKNGYSATRGKLKRWYGSKSPKARRSPELPARLEFSYLSDNLGKALEGRLPDWVEGAVVPNSKELWSHALLAATLTIDDRIVSQVACSNPAGEQNAFGDLFNLVADLPERDLMTKHFSRATTIGFLRYLRSRLTRRDEIWCKDLLQTVRSSIACDKMYPADYAAFCEGICGGLDAVVASSERARENGAPETGVVSFGIHGALLYQWHAVVRLDEGTELAVCVDRAIDLLAEEYSSSGASSLTALFLTRFLAVRGRCYELRRVLKRACDELSYQMQQFYDQANFFYVFGSGKMDRDLEDFGHEYSSQSSLSNKLMYLYLRLFVGDFESAEGVYPDLVGESEKKDSQLDPDEGARACVALVGLARLIGASDRVEDFTSIGVSLSETQTELLQAIGGHATTLGSAEIAQWKGRVETLLSGLRNSLEGMTDMRQENV